MQYNKSCNILHTLVDTSSCKKFASLSQYHLAKIIDGYAEKVIVTQRCIVDNSLT